MPAPRRPPMPRHGDRRVAGRALGKPRAAEDLQAASGRCQGGSCAIRAAARLLHNVHAMIDLSFLVLTGAFFGLSLLYVRACARL